MIKGFLVLLTVYFSSACSWIANMNLTRINNLTSLVWRFLGVLNSFSIIFFVFSALVLSREMLLNIMEMGILLLRRLGVGANSGFKSWTVSQLVERFMTPERLIKVCWHFLLFYFWFFRLARRMTNEWNAPLAKMVASKKLQWLIASRQRLNLSC
jgi:hypothetical protein